MTTLPSFRSLDYSLEEAIQSWSFQSPTEIRFDMSGECHLLLNLEELTLINDPRRGHWFLNQPVIFDSSEDSFGAYHLNESYDSRSFLFIEDGKVSQYSKRHHLINDFQLLRRYRPCYDIMACRYVVAVGNDTLFLSDDQDNQLTEAVLPSFPDDHQREIYQDRVHSEDIPNYFKYRGEWYEIFSKTAYHVVNTRTNRSRCYKCENIGIKVGSEIIVCGDKIVEISRSGYLTVHVPK